MINLLPDNTKQQLRAARVNVILIRYTFVIAIAFAFIVLVLSGSSFLLMQSKSSSEALVEANDTKAQVYSQTQMEINLLSNNLSGAKSILDQQTSYATILRAFGQTMPSGSVIEKLVLDDAALSGSPLTLKVYAQSTEQAVGLKQQLETNPIFTNINIDSISEANGISGYPVSASMTLTINRTAVR